MAVFLKGTKFKKIQVWVSKRKKEWPGKYSDHNYNYHYRLYIVSVLMSAHSWWPIFLSFQTHTHSHTFLCHERFLCKLLKYTLVNYFVLFSAPHWQHYCVHTWSNFTSSPLSKENTYEQLRKATIIVIFCRTIFIAFNIMYGHLGYGRYRM